ncbi:MAG TPA: hypothetical protein VFH63_03515 [candidate division Zixibacteria bacterium]|nr:hypothetical protein [candidate division Zixibacteria bacterium]
MTELHALGAVASLVAAGGLLLLSAAAGALDRGHQWVSRAAPVATAVFALQAGIGLVVMVGGGAFGEGLHLLYGVALAVAVPLALTFASDAPQRARSWVLAVAALVSLVLVWRLYATG